MKLDDCKLENMHYDFLQKSTKFEISCYGDITPYLEELKGLKLKIELKKDTHRSLNANRIPLGITR